MTIRVAHLSDLHVEANSTGVLDGRRPAETLRATLDAFAAHGPLDLIILTGDVSNDATAESYVLVADMVRHRAPVIRWLSGNHDLPALMEEPQLLATGGASVGQWDYLPIATHLPDRHDGGIGADQLATLDSMLTAREDRFVVLGIHHPPLNEICPHPDCQVEDGDALLGLLHRHQCVRAVLSGHLHREFAIERDEVQFLGAPSTWLQINHDLAYDPHYVPTAEPPAGRELLLHDDGTVEARVIVAEMVNEA